MIAPTLLVGLGGTGSKIVCRVSQMVTEEQRKRIGFAVFDTDINELREIREANPFIKTIQTSTKLTVGEYLNIDTHARDEWFPVNGILNSKSLTEGAGQVRAISRLALDTAIRAGNMEPLHNAIEELYKLEGDSSEQALRVVIVSSLAGGTGSGLILPVALYLKNYLATKFQATIKYLTKYGYDRNPLQQVRDGVKAAEADNAKYDPHKEGSHFCDFCGVELAGGEYELLKDGRERCNHCSSTALRTGEEFKEVYKMVVRNMEIFFGIKLNVAIKVRMTDAKTIAKHFGEEFVATPGFDGRVLGFAQKDSSGYSLYIENGSPKLAAMATIAHELTHIWQYQNWDEKMILSKYGKQYRLEIYEGMAKWAEIQYLLYLNEISYAKRQEIVTRLRDDEYGRGFIQYAKKYPLAYRHEKNATPFGRIPPL